ncbi:TolC family protein [Candidatus Margulisiibacteriota bacterium]
MRYFSIFLAIILCASFSACALTWDEAVSIADKNNNELISAKKALEASEWSYRRSISTFLPQLSASVGMTESLTATVAATAKTYSSGLSITQYLFKGMDGIYDIQAAYADLEYEKADLQTTKASVYYDLRYAFIDLLIAQESVTIMEEILIKRQENARLMQLRYESGKEDRGNFMTTQAEELKAKNDLSSAKRDLKLAKLKLSQILKKDISAVEGAQEIKAPSTVDYNELMKDTPSYVKLIKQIESAEIAQRSSISGFLPSISLSGSSRMTGPDWPPDSENRSWSLNLSYPFFPGGSNIADRAIAGAQLDQAKEDFEWSKKELRYSLEDAHEGYTEALESLEYAKVSLAASKERAEINQAKYLNGLVNYDEWNRIENTYIQARQSLLSSRKSAYFAEALWHKTYGGWIK